MTLQRKVTGLCITAILLLLGACASEATVKSNKAASYAGGTKRLLVVADFGQEFSDKTVSGTNERAEFTSIFVDTLNKCGTQAEINEKNALSINDEIGPRIKSFAPDSVLEMHWKDSRTQNEKTMYTNYLLTLSDMRTKSVAWKAEVGFAPRWYRGRALARAIIGQMKTDGIIDASCVVPEEKGVPMARP